MTTSNTVAPLPWPALTSTGPSTTTVGLVADASALGPARHAADRLGLALAVFDPSRDDGRDLAALLGFASGCDAVSVDPAVVGPDRLPPGHLDALREAGHRVWPDPVAVRLSQDRAFARSALGLAGFPVTAGPGDGAGAGRARLSVLVARRPAGWWRARVAAPAGDRPVLRATTLAEARALAVSVADGLGAVGSLAVDLVLTASSGLAVAGVTAGPRPPVARGVDAAVDHLTALLDRPFTGGTGAGRAQEAAAVVERP